MEDGAAGEEEEGVHGGEEARTWLVTGEHHRRAPGGRDGAEAANDYMRRGVVKAGALEGRDCQRLHAPEPTTDMWAPPYPAKTASTSAKTGGGKGRRVKNERF